MKSKLKPMLLTRSNGQLLTEGEWLYERKHDGMRALAIKGKLISRAGIDYTELFPEIKLPSDAILDGEIVIHTPGGESLRAIQARVNMNGPSDHWAATFYAFDLLQLYGVDIMERDIAYRKHLLLRAVQRFRTNIQVVEVFDSANFTFARMADLGAALRWEGIVLKRRHSKYEPGRRSPNWMKAIFPSYRHR